MLGTELTVGVGNGTCAIVHVALYKWRTKPSEVNLMVCAKVVITAVCYG